MNVDELKQAFEAWAKKENLPTVNDLAWVDASSDSNVPYEVPPRNKTPADAADLFWPFVEMYFKRQADPKRGVTAEEMTVLHEFMAKLGLTLKVWQR
jgi:hypothetical protein